MAAYHLVYISRRVILRLIEHDAYAGYSWSAIVFEPILKNFIVVPPVVVLLLVATTFMIDRKVKWLFVIAAHFIFSFLYSLLITSFAQIYEYVVYGAALSTAADSIIINTLFGSNLNFLGYVGFVTIIYSYYYAHEIAAVETQKVQLSLQLNELKLNALKAQLNPHFLFNTLNSISALIKVDAYKAQHMIANLGDLLREILLLQDDNLIPMRKEMIIMNKYVDIMQTRFSDHLVVTIDIDSNVQDALVPTMLFQPIIENCFKHGYSYGFTQLEVRLSALKMGDNLFIKIQNDGTPIPGNLNNEGLGIHNTQQRLNTIYGDNFDFSFTNLANNQGVVTKISIPFLLATRDDSMSSLLKPSTAHQKKFFPTTRLGRFGTRLSQRINPRPSK